MDTSLFDVNLWYGISRNGRTYVIQRRKRCWLLAKPDIQRIFDLFAVMQNIELHGVIGDNVPLEWVNVEQIHREMPRPKLPKDQLRDFCEYQYEQGNLEKRTGKHQDIRQAKAEYKVSEQGKKTIAVFHDPIFQKVKNMLDWTQSNKNKKQEDDEQK